MMAADLSAVRALLIDLDGVVYIGNEVIPEALSFFRRLRADGRRFLLITNNSSGTPDQFLTRLAGMGIAVDPSEILTSALATAQYLAEVARSGAPIFVIGETGLRTAIADAGFELTEQSPEFVVVGLDRSFDYHKLTIAIRAVLAGAHFVGSNPDTTLPAEDGLIPGAGSLQGAIRAATGVEPVVIGKPEPTLIAVALDRLGAVPDQAALIGDRLDTDIMGGHRAGVYTILVLTGVSTRQAAESAVARPSFVADTLDDVAEALGLPPDV